MSLRGEDAESGQQLKQLLLHHRVGRVQRCGAQDVAVRVGRDHAHLFFPPQPSATRPLTARRSIFGLELCPLMM